MNTKGKNLEDEYFFLEDEVKIHKIHEEEKRKEHLKDEQKLKDLHFMKCPRCGHDLKTKRLSYIDVDQCTKCGALVLAKDDVGKFLSEEKSVLKSLIDFFK